MSLFLDTSDKKVASIAICGRCKMKRAYSDLVSDVNAPGLRVCPECADNLDPYRLPARAADKITIQYPRPDEPLTF